MESAPPQVRNLGRKDVEESMLMLLLGCRPVEEEGAGGTQSLGLAVEFIGPCNSFGEGRFNDCDCCDDDDAAAACCCCCICWAAWMDCNEGKLEVFSGDS